MKKSRVEDERLQALAQRMEAQMHGIRRKLRQRLEAEFARGAVTGPQRLVMEALITGEGMSLKELSARVSLAHSTVSGIVDRLEGKGLVEREASGTDRRVTRITVSAPVREFMTKRAPELMLHPLLDALRRASETERKAVQKGLDTLEKLLDAR